MSDRRSRDNNKRRDRRKNESSGRLFLQAPIILDRRERSEQTSQPPSSATAVHVESDQSTIKQQASQRTTEDQPKASLSSIPFMRRPNRFNTDAILKNLSDHPGHFVIGVIGKQGVGKSTLLSHFTQNAEHIFPTQENDYFLYEGHKTDGIDMYITPERAILLDTEPLQSWTVLDNVLRHGSLGGLHADLWLEMETIYTIIFLMSVCNILLVVTEGTEIDLDLLRLIQRAEVLKFNIPDFPLLSANQHDMNYYPDIAFICNKCRSDEFTWKTWVDLQNNLSSFFVDSQLKTRELLSLGNILPSFKYDRDESNLFFLPMKGDEQVESFHVLMDVLRDQVLAGPRRPGRKGQLSEKEWYYNALKLFELVRKSDYINDYLQIVRKLRDT
ncbi:MAG: hypothetical protein EXX96DRAFT_578899 [Benjaminiella poitrasii]|nr:MAG: hypothetical protein EXX96DRAFT_578899 [Benjaminiella poitrasii]